MVTRRPVEIDVLCGTFESQPLAFAHLFDLSEQRRIDLDLDAVEVICKVDPVKRLSHFFDVGDVDEILDAAGLNTTFVLVFPEVGPDRIEGSELLISLGTFSGSRIKA